MAMKYDVLGESFGIEYEDVDSLFLEKGFERDSDFYTIAESACCFRIPILRVKFMAVLGTLPKEEIIPRCKRIIKIHDRMLDTR